MNGKTAHMANDKQLHGVGLDVNLPSKANKQRRELGSHACTLKRPLQQANLFLQFLYTLS